MGSQSLHARDSIHLILHEARVLDFAPKQVKLEKWKRACQVDDDSLGASMTVMGCGESRNMF